jgi:molybdenum ABC transporter molybdate-binding protein
MNRIKTFTLLAILAAFTACKENKQPEKSLLLYCAAGIQQPVAELAKSYSDKYNVKVNIQYGGSGTLLSNLQIAQKGDLYLAGDNSFLDMAKAKGLVKETQPLAQMLPVIIVKKGNPKNIKTIADLKRNDVKVSIGNPEATAVGDLFKTICQQTGDWEAIKANAKVFKPTVNEMAADVEIGSIDACIGWDATARLYDNLETISIGTDLSHMRTVEVGILNYTQQPTEALKFLRFLSSQEHGNPTFQKHGFTPIKGDTCSENPKVVLLSGGMNRLAVEPTIQRFEEREGVEITRIYNGCGVLVAQIKAGTELDAYLTCDTSYLTQVEPMFKDINTLTETKIIIITQKGNPKKINNLADLSKAGLKVGVCNPEQSALGYLVQKLLQQRGLSDSVNKNVCSQTPTADMLVNQLRTGALDAALVYISNVTLIKDKIEIIDINGAGNSAVQNYGIVKKSNNSWMMKRLLEELSAEESVESFGDNGMVFIGEKL